MVQEFLRRRLNPFLLISTVVVLAILAGLSVTYQDVLSDKVSTNQQLSEDLREKNARIDNLENETANLSTELEITRQDLSETINETQRQEGVITDLEGTVSSLNSTVHSLEDTVAEQEANISDLQDEVDAQEEEIADLENDLTTICDDYSSSNQINITGDRADVCDGWD